MSDVSPPPTAIVTTPLARTPLPDPLRRNWIWFALQQIFQTLFTVWFRYRAQGMESLPERGALLLINHQSFLDPLLVGLPLRRPVSYLARENLFRVPVVGWLLRRTYVMPINRESAGTESLRESLRRMEHGFLVGIFPEGTRSFDGGLRELKPGFVALVRRANVPVIPVAVAGAYEAFPRGAWFPRPSRIRIIYGSPLDPTRLAELCQKGREAELVEWTRASIQECLDTANALRT
jgi:1-acyl-sn-glycerol-3-phosphate acyltransferase